MKTDATRILEYIRRLSRFGVIDGLNPITDVRLAVAVQAAGIKAGVEEIKLVIRKLQKHHPDLKTHTDVHGESYWYYYSPSAVSKAKAIQQEFQARILND